MSVIIVNTPEIAHYTIKEYKGLVYASQVVGANWFSDLFASFTEIVGGTSGAYRDRLDDLYDDVRTQLRNKAEFLGANAIVNFRTDFSEISGKGKSMFMLSSVGTAVTVEPDRYEALDKLHKLKVYLNDGLINQEQYDYEKAQIEKRNENILASEWDHSVREDEIARQRKDEYEKKSAEEEERRSKLTDFQKLKEDVIAAKAENIWMLSTDGIKKAELPFILKGKTVDEIIINLLAEDKFNEAGKFYMDQIKCDESTAYDYIYNLLVL